MFVTDAYNQTSALTRMLIINPIYGPTPTIAGGAVELNVTAGSALQLSAAGTLCTTGADCAYAWTVACPGRKPILRAGALASVTTGFSSAALNMTLTPRLVCNVTLAVTDTNNQTAVEMAALTVRSPQGVAAGEGISCVGGGAARCTRHAGRCVRNPALAAFRDGAANALLPNTAVSQVLPAPPVCSGQVASPAFVDAYINAVACRAQRVRGRCMRAGWRGRHHGMIASRAAARIGARGASGEKQAQMRWQAQAPEAVAAHQRPCPTTNAPPREQEVRLRDVRPGTSRALSVVTLTLRDPAGFAALINITRVDTNRPAPNCNCRPSTRDACLCVPDASLVAPDRLQLMPQVCAACGVLQGSAAAVRLPETSAISTSHAVLRHRADHARSLAGDRVAQRWAQLPGVLQRPGARHRPHLQRCNDRVRN